MYSKTKAVGLSLDKKITKTGQIEIIETVRDEKCVSTLVYNT